MLDLLGKGVKVWLLRRVSNHLPQPRFRIRIFYCKTRPDVPIRRWRA